MPGLLLLSVLCPKPPNEQRHQANSKHKKTERAEYAFGQGSKSSGACCQWQFSRITLQQRENQSIFKIIEGHGGQWQQARVLPALTGKIETPEQQRDGDTQETTEEPRVNKIAHQNVEVDRSSLFAEQGQTLGDPTRAGSWESM